MDEVQQARMRVAAAVGASAAHYEAGSDAVDQDVANERLADALAKYRRTLDEE